MWASLSDWLRRLVRGRPLSTGAEGERVAAKFLRGLGYRILASNLHLRAGEVDLVAVAPDHRTIVLVEVKSTDSKSVETGDGVQPIRPEVHVNRAKQHKLTQLAVELVRRRRLQDRPIRFDVIGVDRPFDKNPQVRHHIGAFEATI